MALPPPLVALAVVGLILAVAGVVVRRLYCATRDSATLVSWPLLRHLPTFPVHLHDLHDYTVRLLAAERWTCFFHGPWLSNMELVFTSDPANVNHVFNTRFHDYPKGAEFHEMFEPFGKSGMFTADGEEWKMHHKMVHGLFSDRLFRAHNLKTARDKVELGLVPLLRPYADAGAAIDLQDVFTRYTFDNICAATFGIDPGALSPELPVGPFARALDVIADGVFLRHLVPKYIWKTMKRLNVGWERELTAATEVMNRFVSDQIARRREAMKDSELLAELQEDMLTTYMRQYSGEEDTAKFDRFIHSNAVNLVLAGRDTSASALTWFFYHLLKHPDVKDKIVAELKVHWPAAGEEAGTDYRDTLGKLVYLHAALTESMRLYPPAPMHQRTVSRADVLPSGHEVRPGTMLVFMLYTMARMESVWGEDCCEFRPERWINERGEFKLEPGHKFFVFNTGPRTCVGKEMAYNKMKFVVAGVLRNFEVELLEGHSVEQRMSIILYMKHGLMVRLKNNLD